MMLAANHSIRLKMAAGTLVLAGALAMAGTGAASASVAAPAVAKASQIVVVNCHGDGQIKPAGYLVGCGASEIMTGLRWKTWGTTADGTGTLHYLKCNPKCASGGYTSYSMKTHLWRPQAWPRHSGQRYFTRLNITFPRGRPAGFAKTITVTLRAW